MPIERSDGGRNWTSPEAREHAINDHDSHANRNHERIEQNLRTVEKNSRRISAVELAIIALRKANPRCVGAEPWCPEPGFRQFVVLIVDDDDDDFYLLAVAFSGLGYKHRLMRAHDGLEALNYLRGAGEFEDRGRFPLPDLLLLDLKMPQMDGFDVLRSLRMEKELCRSPVVMLSASDLPKDRDKAMHGGAAGFFTRPIIPLKLAELVRTISDRWLKDAVEKRAGEVLKALA